MIAEQKLSLKYLDQRINAVEETLAVLAYGEAGPPEWLDDVLTGIIAALFQMRQQGAYSLAKDLEAKYFPDGVVAVGDELTTASGLYGAGKKG